MLSTILNLLIANIEGNAVIRLGKVNLHISTQAGKPEITFTFGTP
jgi:hypothetical protein